MSKQNVEKILVCGAWPYVNGDIHIGHLPGYFVPGDITARYFRLKGADVLFVSGTDCHGTPITVEADKRGVTPQEIIDEYDPKVRELITLYDFSYDNFSSTSTKNHHNVTQTLFLQLLENGYILKQTSEQYYSQQDNKFLPDRYVEGECPYCGAQDQRADQCENCGRSLGMGELINPVSKLTGSPVTTKETEHYFIDFPRLQKSIGEFVENSQGEWRDWVKNETKGWLTEGLQPRAITRDLDWGVAIPADKITQDQQIEHIESKRFYVWFDAVIGYLSATIEICEQHGKDYTEFWNNPDSKHYYVMGQDNLTFHTIFWPGQLIGAQQNYTLPYLPSVVKFLNANGQKLSKSRGNIIDAKEVAEAFGADIVKFYITRIMPENKQSNWDWKHFQESINNELVGNIGNFIHRTLVFATKKCELADLQKGSIDKKIFAESDKIFAQVAQLIEQNKFVKALEAILEYSSFGNKYFNDSEPWVVLKEDTQKAADIIVSCVQIVRDLRILLAPFIPNEIAKLDAIVSFENYTPEQGTNRYTSRSIDVGALAFEADPQPLFSKIEDEEFQHKVV